MKGWYSSPGQPGISGGVAGHRRGRAAETAGPQSAFGNVHLLTSNMSGGVLRPPAMGQSEGYLMKPSSRISRRSLLLAVKEGGES